MQRRRRTNLLDGFIRLPGLCVSPAEARFGVPTLCSIVQLAQESISSTPELHDYYSLAEGETYFPRSLPVDQVIIRLGTGYCSPWPKGCWSLVFWFGELALLANRKIKQLGLKIRQLHCAWRWYHHLRSEAFN